MIGEPSFRKGVVFDLDGVLTDTEDLQYLGWVEALEPYGVMLTKEEYSELAGRKRIEIANDLVERHGLDLSPDTLAEAKSTWLVARFEKRSLPLTKGAREIIKFFLEHRVKIAVVSNCRREEFLLKLGGSGLEKYFKVRVCLDDVEKPKPYPDLYQCACERLGFKPQECLALEDTLAGVESAKAAGLTCFAIPSEYSRGRDFSVADRVFADLPEVIDFLRRLL